MATKEDIKILITEINKQHETLQQQIDKRIEMLLHQLDKRFESFQQAFHVHLDKRFENSENLSIHILENQLGSSFIISQIKEIVDAMHNQNSVDISDEMH